MKNKRIWVVPLITTLILLIFATAFYPAYNPKPHDIPMAIVNLDKGTEVQGKKIEIGKQIEQKMMENDQNTLDWHKVSSEAEAIKQVKNGTYAGAIVIDKHFSAHALSPAQSIIMKDKQQEMATKVASGEIPPQMAAQLQQQAPKIPQIEKATMTTYYDEGGQGQLGRVVQQALNQITERTNATVSKQNSNALAQNKVSVPAQQLDAIAHPVEAKSTAYHPIKSNQANGNASMVLFMPVWLASMITAVVLYFNYKKNKTSAHPKPRLMFAGLTLLIDFAASTLGAFAYVYFLHGVLNFNFPNPLATALFISLAVAGFSLLVLGIMVWVGIIAAPLFLLFVFFSMQAVMLPFAMVPKFYQQYILPWNPFKHYTSEITHLIYLNHGFTLNANTWMFIAFILFGIISITSAYYFKKFKS